MRLLRHPRFAPWFWAQLCAVLADNALRAAAAWWAASALSGWTGLLAGWATTAAFAVPFALVSPIAGGWADARDRAVVGWRTRWLAATAAWLGAVGLWAGSGWLVGVGLVGCGLAAAAFGPAKYAVLPDLVDADDLQLANGWLEASTYVGVLLGTVAGLAVDDAPGLLAGAVAAVAALGLAASVWLPSVEPADPTARTDFGPALADALAERTRDPALWWALLGLAWFWLAGQVVVGAFPTLARAQLQVGDAAAAWMLLCLAMGVAAGAWATHRLSDERLELGLAPLGTLVGTVFLADLAVWGAGVGSAWPSGAGLRWSLDFAGTGFGLALFAVPLHTWVQLRAPAARRGRVVGAYAALTGLALGAAVSAGAVLQLLGAGPAWALGALAVGGVGVAWATYRTAPEFLLRFWAFLLSHVLYRVSVEGQRAIPKSGPVVLVCNHVSFVDWLVIMGAVRRPARFVMYKGFAGIPVARVLFRHARVIPIASAKEDANALDQAMSLIHDALVAGEVVVIFPEGALTPNGQIQSFRPGIERIVARDPVPVVPMALNGLWGGFFTRMDGQAMRRPFRRVWSRVWLTIAAPVPPADVRAADLEERVRLLWSRRADHP